MHALTVVGGLEHSYLLDLHHMETLHYCTIWEGNTVTAKLEGNSIGLTTERTNRALNILLNL